MKLPKLKWFKKEGFVVGTSQSGLFFRITAVDRGGCCFARIEWVSEGSPWEVWMAQPCSDQKQAKKYLETLEAFLVSYLREN